TIGPRSFARGWVPLPPNPTGNVTTERAPPLAAVLRGPGKPPATTPSAAQSIEEFPLDRRAHSAHRGWRFRHERASARRKSAPLSIFPPASGLTCLVPETR